MPINNEPVLGTIVFSLVDDTVWASGPGGSVELGHYDPVIHMMRDFLAQCDLGERLNRLNSAND